MFLGSSHLSVVCVLVTPKSNKQVFSEFLVDITPEVICRYSSNYQREK